MQFDLKLLHNDIPESDQHSLLRHVRFIQYSVFLFDNKLQDMNITLV